MCLAKVIHMYLMMHAAVVHPVPVLTHSTSVGCHELAFLAYCAVQTQGSVCPAIQISLRLANDGRDARCVGEIHRIECIGIGKLKRRPHGP